MSYVDNSFKISNLILWIYFCKFIKFEWNVKKCTFAVDSNGATGLFAQFHEAFHDEVRGRAAVGEEQVAVLETGARESRRVVDALVEPHDGGDVVAPEVWKVRFRRVLALLFVLDRVWSAKGDELARNDPVEVAILHTLPI